MTKHQRPLVAKGGTSEYIYRELKSDMDAKRSFLSTIKNQSTIKVQ